jgi:ABC-type transport system involved in multi-copper enzyme maturation permease subunit
VAYLAGIVLSALFFLTLHYFTELSKKQKAFVTAMVLTIILFAIGFNKYNNIAQEKMMNTVLLYNQGKTIQCDGLEVNKETYTLSVGTYTFIGKEGTSNYSKMISASTCRE